MDFIENLLSHMSSTFNSNSSILPKHAEIAEDETFKWRALKNNQFASRSKNSQTKRLNNNISSSTLSEDIHASNTANEIVIEIANGISNAEIQEALIQQSSPECQIHKAAENASEPYVESKETQESSYTDDTCDKNDTENGKTIKLHDGITETVSTSNLFKQMSSTFNSTGELSIKNITELSGAKQKDTYENSDIHNKSAKKQLKSVRRSNRLKQDNSDYYFHKEPSRAKSSQEDVNDLNLAHNTHNSELLQETNTSAMESADCKNTEHVHGMNALDDRANLNIQNISKCEKKYQQKKISPTAVLNVQKAVSNIKPKKNGTKNRNSSHTKYLNLKTRLTTNKQKNRKKLDSKRMSSSKNQSVRENYESALNVFSKAENMFTRPIKLTAKILANKKLRHGFELQNSVRLSSNQKIREPSEPSPEFKMLPEIEQTSVSILESSPSKKGNPEIHQFICEIKRLNLANNKSPEADRNLSESQLLQLLKVKERHFCSLGLLSTSTNTFRKSKAKPYIRQKEAFELYKKQCLDERNEHQISSKNHKRNPSIKMKAFEKCFCEKRFPLFTAKTQNQMHCTAIDDVNGQLVKCGNKLEGKAHHFLRPCKRSSYQLLCVLHNKRFRQHGCCARCGIYCTQGEFSICSKRHLFHTKCAEKCESGLRQRFNAKLYLKCPHCGMKESSEKLKTLIQLMID